MINSVLFGNGFNRLESDNPSWACLLDAISKDCDAIHCVPPTFQYEYTLLQYLNNNKGARDAEEISFKRDIAKRLSKIKCSKILKDLQTIGVKLFLTPNFDSAFYGDSPDKNQFAASDTSEQIYSLHRWHKLVREEKDIVVYPYHGEIFYPKTIELRFDHYCGAIGKIDKYIKGSYTFSSAKNKFVTAISARLKNNSVLHLSDFNAEDHGIPDILSWIDAFFFTNLHIIGFGLEFSEIDIWWILNRRARLIAKYGEKRVKNKIYYYPTDPISATDGLLLEKYKALRRYDVNVVPHHNMNELSTGIVDYVGIYDEQLKNLKENL